DENGRVDFVNHIAQVNPMVFEGPRKIGNTIRRLGVSPLLFGQIRALGMQQPTAIDEPEAGARFGFGQIVGHKSFPERIGHPDPGGTRAQRRSMPAAFSSSRCGPISNGERKPSSWIGTRFLSASWPCSRW